MPLDSATMDFDYGTEFEDLVPEAVFAARENKWENKSTLTKRRDTYSFIDPYRFKNALRGKVVLITQAHRGIGRATAVAFAQAGASVCMVGPTAQSLEALLLEIKEKWNTPTLALTASFKEPEAPARLVELVMKHRGPIDILINVTLPSYLRPIANEPDMMQDWWRYMESNLRVPVSLIHAVLPSMIERKFGIIISTCAAAAIIPIPFTSAGSAAVVGLIKFHEHLDLENRSKGILSFAVNPGPVPSHIHDPAVPFAMNPEHIGKDPRHIEMVGVASEVNWAAAGLASGTFLALCADPRAKILAGLYVNAERDIEELIGKMEKDPGRKVERQKLYTLKTEDY